MKSVPHKTLPEQIKKEKKKNKYEKQQEFHYGLQTNLRLGEKWSQIESMKLPHHRNCVCVYRTG